ncbi:hypothetical protein SporoP8_15950 [Sporosarcina ureae]|nr:hypothetical protein SporoP8_15950 [Sporosarcina ureae]
MNAIVLLTVLFSLLISTIACIWIFKLKRNKWLSALTALVLNSVILLIATVIFYNLDVQVFHKQTGGVFSSLGILVFAFFIPVLTLINFYTLEFMRYQRKKISY